MPGYTIEDKLEIAACHLLPRQAAQHGLQQVRADPDTLRLISKIVLSTAVHCYCAVVEQHTSEPGVRGLERRLAALCRSLAVRQAEAGAGAEAEVRLDQELVEEVLGPGRQRMGPGGRLGLPGVAVGLQYCQQFCSVQGVQVGLAWTGLGGELMVVEASLVPGSLAVSTTGNLGPVMAESAQLAIAW